LITTAKVKETAKCCEEVREKALIGLGIRTVWTVRRVKSRDDLPQLTRSLRDCARRSFDVLFTAPKSTSDAIKATNAIPLETPYSALGEG
jgi:hypothetical protein